jgi:hypothetical protein
MARSIQDPDEQMAHLRLVVDDQDVRHCSYF